MTRRWNRALNEVRVEVHAAGVNRPDLMQRQGKYPPPPGASDIPGLELSGIIDAVGPSSKARPPRWAPGDLVCALVAGGGYAERCGRRRRHSAFRSPVPRRGSGHRRRDPETYFTVWTNVFQRGQLATGESHPHTRRLERHRHHRDSAREGVRRDGLRHCRDRREVPRVRALGARAINYKTTDFVDAIAGLTVGRGVNVILDIIGGDYLERNLKALAIDGRLVQIGLQGGARSDIDLRTMMQRRLTLTGSTLGPRSVAEKAAIARDLEQHVWPLLARESSQPVVDRTLPLDQAAEAHRLLESGEVVGKIVLTVG